MMYAQKHATYFIVNHVVFMQCHPVLLGPSLKQTVGGLGSMKKTCQKRSCCWDPDVAEGTPYCYVKDFGREYYSFVSSPNIHIQILNTDLNKIRESDKRLLKLFPFGVHFIYSHNLSS